MPLNTRIKEINQKSDSNTQGYNDGNIIAHKFGGGTAYTVQPQAAAHLLPIIGKITDKGPKEEADFTNYRYWVQIWKNTPANAMGTLHTAGLVLNAYNPNPNEKEIVCGFHFIDVVSGGRTLIKGDPVTVFPVCIDVGVNASPNFRWMIIPNYQAPRVVRVKKFSGAGGGGGFSGTATWYYDCYQPYGTFTDEFKIAAAVEVTDRGDRWYHNAAPDGSIGLLYRIGNAWGLKSVPEIGDVGQCDEENIG